ncbi:MAG: LacI family DNA-binding transcriptional regulator [Chitinophagaceae bacterium]
MRKKALVIGDIAKELNVSITSVSFILNGKAKEKRISADLAERVLKYAKKVNYSPNHLAKSLRTGKTNLIGLIVEDISNPFFANVARLIEEAASLRGFRIIYCSSDNDTSKTSELIRVFLERQVDAYIITPSAGTEEDINFLLKKKCHVVLFDRYFPNVNTNYVIVDNAGSTYNAINHFIEQGYKNIAFVTLASGQTQMQERYNGYARAIKESKLKLYTKKIPYHENSKNYIEEIEAFLIREVEIDAIFFATNYLGISGLEAINKLKRKIPSEIGVITFDDHDLFRLHSPSITAVAQPIQEMSVQLINILLNNVDAKSIPVEEKKVVLPAPLIIRESSLLNHKQVGRQRKSGKQISLHKTEM